MPILTPAERSLRLSAVRATALRVSSLVMLRQAGYLDAVPAIAPVLAELMTRYPQVVLHLSGHLDAGPSLQPFSSRIRRAPFVAWQELPELIAQADINLAVATERLDKALDSGRCGLWDWDIARGRIFWSTRFC